LLDVKARADEKVMINTRMLENEGYFEKMLIQMVIGSFSKNKIELDPETAKYINTCLVREYMNEYQGQPRW
jgi:type I restriction enzyme R subunit